MYNNTENETCVKRPTCNDQHEWMLARASNFWKLLPSVIILFKVMTPKGYSALKRKVILHSLLLFKKSHVYFITCPGCSLRNSSANSVIWYSFFGLMFFWEQKSSSSSSPFWNSKWPQTTCVSTSETGSKVKERKWRKSADRVEECESMDFSKEVFPIWCPYGCFSDAASDS